MKLFSGLLQAPNWNRHFRSSTNSRFPSTVVYAFPHGTQILKFVYLAPIHAFFQCAFEHQVEPDTRAASIAFHERMRYVHFNVFVHDLFKRRFRHGFYDGKRGPEMTCIGKRKLEANLFRDFLRLAPC